MIEYINYAVCTHCGVCYDICPMDVFEKVGGIIRIAHENDCETCFQCEGVCPTEAIYVGPFRPAPVVLVFGECDPKYIGKTSDELKQKLKEKGIIKETKIQTSL